MMEYLLDLSAWEIAEKIAKKEISAEVVIRTVFDRIEKTEKQIGSFVHLRKENALKDALEVDRKIKNNEKIGALAGVPIAIKDNMVMKDERSNSSSKILNSYESIYNSTVVEKIKEADGIIIGTTNMDEMAMGSSTKTSFNGATKNPWDIQRVPGGSSGGSATSIAAKQVFLSLGSDTGGSIRQPASFCGVVGMKPTYGRVSRYGLMAFASSMDQIGPFSKTVKDAAFMLNVISGKDEYDATLSTREVPNYLDSIGKSISGMKIGIPKEYFIDGIQPGVKKIIEDSIELIKKMGGIIVPISLPHTKYAVATYYVIAPAEASSNLARYDGVRYGYRNKEATNIEELYSKSRTEGFGDEVKRRIIIGTYVLNAGYFEAYFKKAQKVRNLIKQDFDNVFETVDIIVTPVSPTTAFKLEDKKTLMELYLEDIFTISANLAGIPGLTVPAGLAQGLPVGIQFLAKAFDEEKLFAIGSAFELERGKFEMPIL